MKRRRPNGAWVAAIDLLTFGLFLLFYIPPIEKRLKQLTGKDFLPYWVAYLWGWASLFIVPVVWVSLRAKELREAALEAGLEGGLTSFKEMFLWNIPGFLTLFGPLFATYRFFDTFDRLSEGKDV